MKTAQDYDYFMNKTLFTDNDGKKYLFCGEYGKCAICGKKSQKYWLGFGIFSQFHFCSSKHMDIFINYVPNNNSN